MSNKFNWICTPARKKNKKGREEDYHSYKKKFERGNYKRIKPASSRNKNYIMENRWNIITIYSQNIEETMEIITEYIQEEKEDW